MKRLGLWLVVAIIACGAPKAQVAVPSGTVTEPGAPSVPTHDEASKEGFVFKLRETASAPEKAPRERTVQGKPLSARDVERLFKGVAAPAAEPDDQKPFAKREGSPPPVTAVEQVKAPFPPPPEAEPADKAKSGPVEIVRIAPEGDVGLVRELSVTFNQPMVALTSHDESVSDVPVKLSPAPRGHFRWVGTRTLLFTADPRFPLASEYTVTVPKGTRSVSGNTLAQDRKVVFRTPALEIVDALPTSDGAKSGVLPLVYLAFNQKVRADAVLSALSLEAKGQKVPLRLATEQEIAEDREVKSKLDELSGQGLRENALVLRPEETLPAETRVTLTLAKGCTAGEGPRGTQKAFSRSFDTHGPLALKKVECGDGSACHPGYNVVATFTTTIDWERVDPAWVRIEPSVEMNVWPSGESLYVTAQTLPRTKYTLHFSPAIRDIFGQTLGKEQSATFEVGDARPEFSSAEPLVMLDPRDKQRAFHVESINVDELVVQVRRVSPADYLAYAKAREQRNATGNMGALPGQVVHTQTLSLKDRKNERVDTAIDVSPALSAGLGHAIVTVEPRPRKFRDYQLEPIVTWVQATELAVDAFWDPRELLTWTTSLADGRAQQGVTVEVEPDGVKLTSDADGLARTKLLAKDASRVRVLVARRGNDSAILPEHPWGLQSASNWTVQPSRGALRFHVFDDRGIYKPGETLRAKGWVRVSRRENQRLPELPKGLVDTVKYQIADSAGTPIAEGTAKLNDQGGFDFSVPIPKTAHLGSASLSLTAKLAGSPDEEGHWHGFQIEEYRKPEYEVALTAKEPAHFLGRPIALEAKASYHAGGPLAEAKTTWTVHAEDARFTPPGRDTFTFGEPPVWWELPMVRHAGRGHIRFPGGPRGEPSTLVGRTDAQGLHTIEIMPESATPAYVQQLAVSAAVEDVNRQNFADHLTLLVHPAEVYVGLRSARAFSEPGEAVEVEAIVTDLDGKAVKGRPLTVALVQVSGKYEKGEYKTTETEVEHCALESGDDVVRCALHPQKGGSYRIAARVLDARNKPSDTYLRHWVAGEESLGISGAQLEQVELLTDKREYAPGEKAKVLLRAPFAPADVLLRVSHGEITDIRHFHIEKKSHTLELELKPEHVPNLTLHADVVGRREATGAYRERPAYAAGEATLAVTLEHLRLKVQPTAELTSLQPGASTKVVVSVQDARGEPVEGADVALVVVDEAVLQLTGRETADPLSAMHPSVESWQGSMRARDWVLAPREDKEERQAADGKAARAAGGMVLQAAAAPESARMAADTAGGGLSEVPTTRLRTLFDPLALFAASLRSDKSGKATATVKVPDTLTRYRVLAVAARGGQNFGFGESALTVQKPLMLRPAAPRFVNLGDQVSLPVVVQNASDQAMEVDLAVRATNLTLGDVRALRVSVPAHDRVEVRFSAAAARPGTVRVQFAAASGKLGDATELSLPAWTPATDEAFATYGDVERDGAIRYALSLPKNVAPEFGGLDLSMSSTQLSALTDAMLSTLESRYDMPEQRASRILAALSVRDVLSAFQAKGVPDAAAIDALVEREVKELARLQHGDGGFGYYSLQGETDPYVSVHVSHALARASAQKLAGGEQLVPALRDYVRRLPELQQRAQSKAGDKAAEKAAQATVLAYGAYTEFLWGEPETKLAGLARERGGAQLSSEGLGWLMPVFHARGDKASVQALLRLVLNRVNETAGAAQITSDARDGKHLLLASTDRANAVVLEALVRTASQPDLAPKLVRGLLAGQKRGMWEGTQENVFALLALRAYFDAFEKDVPQFNARAFVGNALAQSARFQGRSTKQESTRVPMPYLNTQKPDSVTLEKRGAGRLYYRLGLAYAPANFVLTPRDHGFVVERAYEAVDDPKDVRRDADGVYRVRAGARVRVVLSMVAPTRRHHVALVDPLPAGFEPINPALAVSEPLPDQPAMGGGGPVIPLARMIWPGPWFAHQNLRDERVEAHAAEVEAGVYTYTYYARATTPGSFIAPPVKAEEVYAPETFGRGETARVVVE